MCRESARMLRPERTQIRFLCLLFLFFFFLLPFMLPASAQTQTNACCGNFLPGVNYAVPGRGQLAVGDLNGDGKPDIVIANQDSTVSVLLGNGDGTFQPQYTVRAEPAGSPLLTEAVATGDFNGDGAADLAVLSVSTLNFAGNSSATGAVEILLNDGTGHFGAPIEIPLNPTTETGPAQILVAKFGADTNLDLAVLDTGSGNVSILRGNGDGTFAAAVDYATGSTPAEMTTGDLNKDGYLDLAVAGTASSNGVVGVLLGSQNGSFGAVTNWITTAASVCTQACAAPTTVTIGDFNGDGKPDLAVNDGFVGGIFVLLGNGDGSFQEPPLHSANAAGGAGAAQEFLTSADYNGDGKADLAMGEGGIYPEFTDLLFYAGNGDGTFPDYDGYSEGTAGSFSSATDMVATDLNGDAFTDLVMATNTGYATGAGYNAVTVVMNCGLKCTGTTLTSSTASSGYGQTVTFTATVSATNVQATGTPTGTVTFQEGTTTLGTATLSGGQASFTDSALSLGTHYVVAYYQGDANFVPSNSASVTQVVGRAATTTTAGSSVDPSSPGQSVTFTATVTASTSGVPTGTVVFADNGTQSVSVPLDATGTASYSTSSLSTGTHSITWSYSGDTNYQPSTSAALTQIVGTNAAPYAMSASASSATVTAGQSATISISVAAVPSFKSNVSFSCSGLPTGAACQFSPASVNPEGSTVMTSLTITTTGSGAEVTNPGETWPGTRVLFLLILLPLAFLAMLWRRVAARPAAAPRSAMAEVGLWLAIGLAAVAAGCGGGTQSGPKVTPTPAGSSQVVVTGASGSVTQSVTITLNVQ